MARPRIGIISNLHVINDSYRTHAGGVMNSAAVAEVTDGLPLLIPADPRFVSVDELLETFDGFVLTGGRPNVHPEEYGEDETEAHGTFDRARDAITLPLVRACVERGQPVFGICRGLQVLNVACGGTLWPDISDGGFETAAHTGGTRDTDDVYHPVTMSGVEFEVTSHHHEGVRDLGEGLEVISRAEDGMVEALRHRELPWLGVQWHPERTATGAGRSLMQEWLRSQC